jgi:hypothetical protein
LPRKPIACPACGALVSGGRLSCPACGTLVAAVSGANPVAKSSALSVPAAKSTAPPGSTSSGAGPKSPPARSSATRTPAAGGPLSPQPRQAEAAASAFPKAAAPAFPQATPGPIPPGGFAPASAPEPPIIRPSRTGSILSQLEARRPAGPPEVPPAPVRPVSPSIPGSYLAPSAAFIAPTPGARPVRVDESSFLRSSGAYAASAAATSAPVALAPALSSGPTAAPFSPSEAAQVQTDSARSTITVGTPTELPGWLAIAGSAIAAVSFLMPWSRDGVIGAIGSGYFDRWGLANSGYLPVVLATLALLAINGIPNPIPVWIRAGIAPLLVGGVTFGLDWAYQTRPYSDGLGVTLLLVGSLVLIVGGILGVRSARHPAPPPLV